MELKTIPLQLIDPHPRNPRGTIDETDPDFLRLVESIKLIGILQSPGVRRHPLIDGRYQLEFGERRTRAARAAGLTEIAVYVAEHDDDTAFLALIAENELQKPLTPEERNIGLQGVLELADAGYAAGAVGVDVELVNKARRGRQLVDKVKLQQASLEELAVLAEFEGTEYLSKLESQIGGCNFNYFSNLYRSELKAEHKKEELRAQALEAGGTEERYDVNQHTWLDGLVTQNGDSVDPASVTPGKRLFTVASGQGIQWFTTTEYAKYRGWSKPAAEGETDEERAEREAKEAEQQKYREEAEASRENRWAFLRSILAYVPKSIIAVVWSLFYEDRGYMPEIDAEEARKLIGDRTVDKAAEVDAALIVMADNWATCYVYNMDEDDARLLMDWLGALVDAGYIHTPWESERVNEAAQIIADAEEAEKASRKCSGCAKTEANGGECSGDGDDPACPDYAEAGE